MKLYSVSIGKIEQKSEEWPVINPAFLKSSKILLYF